MKKDTRMIAGICIVLLVVSGILFWQRQSRMAGFSDMSAAGQGIVLSKESGREAATEKQKTNIENSNTEAEECAVYVSGAIKKAGLFRYRGTARVSDAIKARGGFTKNADTNAINLARILSDGEQIQVPTKRETKADGKKTQAEHITDDEGQTSQTININKASLEELMTLPGIGQAKAALIIEYRTEHGLFSKKEDIMNISGIKEGVYNKIRNFIVIT